MNDPLFDSFEPNTPTDVPKALEDATDVTFTLFEAQMRLRTVERRQAMLEQTVSLLLKEQRDRHFANYDTNDRYDDNDEDDEPPRKRARVED